MGKIIVHCVRHAQGYHNLTTANHSLPDPVLTPLGEEQCASLASSFPTSHLSQIKHLVSSPLRRTIYTTLLSFPSCIQHGLPVIALPELQEASSLPCDTGSSPSLLINEFSTGKYAGAVDLSLVTEGWNSNTGKWDPASSALDKRARDARRWLRELGMKTKGDGEIGIVVVTHGGFLHYFTEDWDGADKFLGTGWSNTEFRTYEFVSETDDGASLSETKESRERRRGREIPLTEDEQREIRSSKEKSWALFSAGSELKGEGEVKS